MDYDISGLPSYIFYSKLDRAPEDYSKLGPPSWAYFVTNHEIKKKSIFNALLKAFYYVSYYDKSDEPFYGEQWNYLYFWVGHKVLNVLGESSFSDIMPVLKAVGNRVDRTEVYNDDLFKITTQHFKDLKEIYDYSQNYSSIYAKIGPSNSDCTSSFKEYVEKGYNAYNTMKRKCSGNHIDDYCKIFHRFEKKYEMNKITNLKCTGTKAPEVRLQPQHSAMPFIAQAQGPEGSVLKPEMGGMLHGMSIPKGGTPTTADSTDVFPISLLVLGSLSICFLFFKFSPVRSWLYSKVLKKEIIGSIEDEKESEEIFQDSYVYSNRDFIDTSHHIPYHNMHNS
ncbi:PIR Superfamily Protein [Plasmodium ovale wallikeri]|uniref:PIR Superfamily Protein n=1 Tax=Plasmodium ovale wallikeri TaxID=864142 RepID=A0A1A9AS05_PLAOA|nr:PIR Superfamily Protein [Plasmodium ovale wallikeri]SBT59029.1 PIR Superfamily Protein [Plasmodium ovale wallikeri]